MPDKSLSALRREALTRAWRVGASMTPWGPQIRLVVNATREAGGATELTSTAYLAPNAQAARTLARRLAEELGFPGSAILWAAPALASLYDDGALPALAA
ncbi:MAG: hypothetical protein JWM33_1774 [Caulobacteraceae bacterium]|nr:hypothetical protein [Caulobacteraceae bacterium]